MDLAGQTTIEWADRHRPWSRQMVLWVLKQARHHPTAAVAVIIALVLVLLAAFGEALAPFDPITTTADLLQGPNLTHFMGTDEVGRDLFSRIVVGTRPALTVGTVAVAIGVAIGSVIGIVSGFYRGATDLVLQRVIDGMMAFPPLVLALALVALLGPGLRNGMLAVAIALIPSASRIVRGSVLSVGQELYVHAAQCLGASPLRIMFRHILPNVLAPIVIVTSTYLGGAILLDASLSFLGMGTQPPAPSWGSMLSGAGRQYFERDPWIGIFPGLAISLTVLVFNIIGDAVRDELDPRLRTRN